MSSSIQHLIILEYDLSTRIKCQFIANVRSRGNFSNEHKKLPINPEAGPSSQKYTLCLHDYSLFTSLPYAHCSAAKNCNVYERCIDTLADLLAEFFATWISFALSPATLRKYISCATFLMGF